MIAELSSIDNLCTLTIDTLGYEYPEASNKYDADWYMNIMVYRCPSKNISIKAPVIEGVLLDKLVLELSEFIEGKQVLIEFAFTEPELSFSIAQSSKGFIVKGEIMEEDESDSEFVDRFISFIFDTDLDNIVLFHEALSRVLELYPSRYSDWELPH